MKPAPAAYDPDHPLSEDLKRKDFVAVAALSEQAACSAAFLEEFAATSRDSAP